MIIRFIIEDYDRYSQRYIRPTEHCGEYRNLDHWRIAAKVDESYGRRWSKPEILKAD